MASSQTDDQERLHLVSQSTSSTDTESENSDQGTDASRKETAKSGDGKDAKELEGLLDSTGYGLFHVIFMTLSGIVLVAYAVEVVGVGFVLPIADEDLNLTAARKKYLNIVVLAGMLIGGYLWGSLADVFGRKGTLISAMLLNGVCGLIAAFSSNFLFFLSFKVASGIGAGGALPIIIAYVGEFYNEKRRGQLLILLVACKPVGIIYASFFAWLLLGTPNSYRALDFYIAAFHVTNWRVFLMVCTVPAFLSTTAFLFLTESPAFLYQVGHINELSTVLRTILKMNFCSQCCWFKRPSIEDPDMYYQIRQTEEEEEEGQASPSSDVAPFQRLTDLKKKSRRVFCSKIDQIAITTLSLFKLKYVRATVILMVIYFVIMSSNTGFLLWLPEFFKRVETVVKCEDLGSVWDYDYLKNCSENATAITPQWINGSDGPNLEFYLGTLYVSLASLLGIVLGVSCIPVVGERVLVFSTILLSAVTMLFIWILPNVYAAVVGLACLYSGTMIVVYGALAAVDVNIYSVTARSTAIGLLIGFGRIGSILSYITFSYLLVTQSTLPMLIIALILFVGAVTSLFLPPMYHSENRPPLLKAVGKWRTWLLARAPIRKQQKGAAD